jgi:hypothetical protein
MRSRFYIFLLLFLAACKNSDSDKDPQVNSDTGSLTSTKMNPEIEFTFETPNDTTKNFYVTVFPKGEIRGTLILLSGFGDLPTETLKATDIYKYASQSGYITLIPALGDNLFFYLDKVSNEKLYRFIDTVFKKYKLPTNNFFIGGYSLGGSAAFQYTEQAYAFNSKLRKPTAVFGADPLLDLERQYNYMVSIDRPAKNPSSAEGEKTFTDLFEEIFKTNPKNNPKFFWNISPFSASDPKHETIKPLVDVPLRTYSDPDINWYIENRHVDFTDLNITDQAAMINWLRSMGNKKAELIISLGKGYKHGMRAPHSWSIIDGKKLVEWMNNQATITK